ncbi:eCIS core domain-containing protein [Agrococcus sp. DT81.2]|uniref:eCIS core domain-containing protein n=1 Tax=Agrococcus sp. DT81.2 TaxID=3393414 RepID=UPI003CE5BEAA
MSIAPSADAAVRAQRISTSAEPPGDARRSRATRDDGPSHGPAERAATSIADELARVVPALESAPVATGSAGGGAPAAPSESRGSMAPLADGHVPAHIASVVAGGGAPLPVSVRAPYEVALGVPLTHVRVHTGSAAERSARRIGADAYTAGSHIVFGADRWDPSGGAGRNLLGHELVHTLQSPPRVRRRPDPKAAAQLPDPVAATGALPGYGFFPAGPDFTGMPGLADVRRVLVDTAAAEAATLDASTVREHVAAGGDMPYYAFAHPTLGVIARAGTALAGHEGSGRRAFYGVYVFADESEALRLRPVGGTGEHRSPVGLVGEMADVPVLGYAELQARLSLLDRRLAAMDERYAKSASPLVIAIAVARKQVTDRQRSLVSDRDTALRVQTALELIDWIDQDLALMDRHREQLLKENKPVRALDSLYADYAAVLQRLLDAKAMDEFERTQKQAERLPAREAIDTLRKAGRFTLPGGDLLPDSEVIEAWADDLRARVDAVYDRRDRGTDVFCEAAFLELAIRGLQLYTQRLAIWVQFFNARPGVLDTPLVGAMNRLRDRVHAIKDAYDTGDVNLLRQRVESMEKDPAIADFYRALPAAMQVTQLIARVGITALAALASGGVGGLLARGTMTAARGLTLRTAAAFVGRAALEAVVFTGVNAAASAAFLGDQVSLGSLLRDFAWNLGLFMVLKGVGGATGRAVRALEIEALAMPVNVSVSFPFAHGWGILRFRVENNRWPTTEELDRMTAESLVMLGAIAVGSAGVQRWVKAHAKSKSLSLIRAEYGWRLDALESIRADLGAKIRAAEVAGKGNDAAELQKAKDAAATLEASFREVLERAIKDKRLDMKALRAELNAMREQAPDIAARLIEDVLGVPTDAQVRRAAPASYTYGYGKTSAVEDALAASGYKVTKAAGKGGLKTITATAPDRPVLTFQERSAALDFDTGLFDVRKLMIDLRVTTPAAQKMIWRILQSAGMSQDPVSAVGKARARIKELLRKAEKSANETDAMLAAMHERGMLGSGAKPELLKAGQSLRDAGVLKSAEWADARDVANQRGVVGEWLAREAVPAAAGESVLRRVTVTGDLFEDAAGKVPVKDAAGAARVGTTVAETDLLYVRSTAGGFEAETVINVKASGEKGMAASAKQQNANFEAVLRAKPGDIIAIASGKTVRFARVTAITALDGTTAVDLTGRLKPAGTLRLETVGPAKSSGFTRQLSQGKSTLTELTELLAEMALIEAGLY